VIRESTRPLRAAVLSDPLLRLANVIDEIFELVQTVGCSDVVLDRFLAALTLNRDECSRQIENFRSIVIGQRGKANLMQFANQILKSLWRQVCGPVANLAIVFD
jgi:hypothetical protein